MSPPGLLAAAFGFLWNNRLPTVLGSGIDRGAGNAFILGSDEVATEC